MTILPIRIWGDPVLHSPAQPVSVIDDDVRTLISDMFETMDAAPGVGLAAPQVGVPLCIYTYSFTPHGGELWRGAIINPQLWMTPTRFGDPDKQTESEGCLSFPDYKFPIVRSDHVRVSGLDVDGQPVQIDVTGWKARIMQHEFDHLNGGLYINRLAEPYRSEALASAEEEGWGVPGKAWLPQVEEG